MTEPKDFDENVNEEKNLEIKTESTKPASTEAYDNEVGKIVPLSSISTPNELDINSKSDETTSNLDNQTNPKILNELANEQNSPNFSAILNNDKQTSSPDISIISNSDRQFNPTTLNESTVSNESNNDKQNSSSNTLNDLSDDKQNSSVISNDDNQTSSPNISNDDKQSSSPNISTDDKKIDSPTISSISNEDKKIDSPTISPISNDDKKIDSPTISPTSNDDKKIDSPTISPTSNDDKKIDSPTISPTSNDDKKIDSPTISPTSNDDKKIDSSTTSPTSNEYLYDNSKESNQPLGTNEDSSKHDPSEDNIISNAVKSESEIQEEKEQNQFTDASLHDNNSDDESGFEILQKDKLTDSIEDLSKHGTDDGNFSFQLTDSIADSKYGANDGSFSFIDNEPSQLTEPIVEDSFKNKPNDDDINTHNENKFTRDFDEKSNNNETVERNSDDDDYYDDDDSHNESENIEEKEDHETKTEANQHAIADENTFKPDSSTQNHIFDVSDDDNSYTEYTEPKKNELDQQIRERRRLNQQHQELSSPSKDITPLKSSNVRKTDTHHSSISLSKIIRNTFLSLLIFALFYVIYDIYRLSVKPSSLRNIADITDNIFEEINGVKLPATSTISDYSVEIRRAAITVDRSASFKSYGSQIAKGLIEIGDKIYKTRELLQYMYSKGSTLQTSFESEIDAILQRLNSNHMRQDDTKFIRDRLDKLMKKIKDIKLLVEKSHNSILDAKKIRINIDDDIQNGLKDAEKYNKNEKYSADIDKAKREFENVDYTLSKLYINIGYLEQLREILCDYGDKLMGVSDELDELGDKGARILKEDIKLLRLAVEKTRVRNHNFNSLAKTN